MDGSDPLAAADAVQQHPLPAAAASEPPRATAAGTETVQTSPNHSTAAAAVQHPAGADTAAEAAAAAAVPARGPTAATEQKPSTVDVLTQLIMQQQQQIQQQQQMQHQQQMTELMTRLMSPVAPAVQPGSSVSQHTAAETGSSGGPPRRRSSAPVPRLPSSASLRDFDAWSYRFREFRVSERLSELPAAEQRAVLLSSLDDEWLRFVRFGLPLTTAEADVDSIIAAMLAHLRRQRNPVSDRRDFDTRVQERGETVDEYICALREIAAFCDLCPACYDDRLRDRLVVGTTDDDARRRMLEVTDLTLRKAIDICRASESAVTGSTTIGGSAAVSKVSSYRRSYSRAVSPDSRSPSVSSTDGRSSTRCTGPACLRCGARPHPDGAICPAASRRCYACDQVGHFSAVCPRRTGRGGAGSSPAPARGRARPAGDGLQMSPVVHAGGTSDREPYARRTQHVADVLRRGHLARRTPRVRLQLRRADGRMVETEWTPDTGAETSALSLRSAEKMGLRGEDLQPPAFRLLNADNRELECVGTSSVILKLGDVVKTVDVCYSRPAQPPAVVARLYGPRHTPGRLPGADSTGQPRHAAPSAARSACCRCGISCGGRARERRDAPAGSRTPGGPVRGRTGTGRRSGPHQQ